MGHPRGHLITLQVSTVDGIFTVRVNRCTGEGRHFVAGLRGSSIYAIAADPKDNQVILVGCGGAGAGLYYSRDAGLTWEAPGLWPFDREVWALAFHPRDPRVIIAGTHPPAAYRSTDRGYTWDELPGLQAVPGRETWTFPHAPYQARVRQFSFDLVDPERVLAAVEVGGVLCSKDGGSTWLPVGREIDPDAHAVTFWPGGANVALAATGGGLFRSTTGGKRWCKVESEALGPYVVSLAAQRQAPWLIFSASRGGRATICRSEDGGETWTAAGADLPAPALGVDALAIDPDEPGTLFYGAQHASNPQVSCLYSSVDSGQSWRQIALDTELPQITRLAVT